jgi:hypothetical protein
LINCAVTLTSAIAKGTTNSNSDRPMCERHSGLAATIGTATEQLALVVGDLDAVRGFAEGVSSAAMASTPQPAAERQTRGGPS